MVIDCDKIKNMTLPTFLKSQQSNAKTDKMPVLFVGHGSPMNAIEDNVYSKNWELIGKSLPKPKAILCISAHWTTPGSTQVTAMKKPETIHDFYGFPDELNQYSYPALGDASLAKSIAASSTKPKIQLDERWGLDHGTWSVLCRMYPDANIPVIQLSLDETKSPQFHFDTAKQLSALREKGVLIVGSGNLVHNLGRLRMNGQPFDWAIEFDEKMAEFLRDRNDQAVIDFLKLGSLTNLAHPTHEHFLPLLYSLAQFEKDESVEFFNEGIDLGSISMRSFLSSK